MFKVWYECMHVHKYIYIKVAAQLSVSFSEALKCTWKIFLWNCFVFIDYILSLSLYPTSWSLLWTTSFPASLSSINKSLGFLSKKRFHPHLLCSSSLSFSCWVWNQSFSTYNNTHLKEEKPNLFRKDLWMNERTSYSNNPKGTDLNLETSLESTLRFP